MSVPPIMSMVLGVSAKIHRQQPGTPRSEPATACSLPASVAPNRAPWAHRILAGKTGARPGGRKTSTKSLPARTPGRRSQRARRHSMPTPGRAHPRAGPTTTGPPAMSAGAARVQKNIARRPEAGNVPCPGAGSSLDAKFSRADLCDDRPRGFLFDQVRRHSRSCHSQGCGRAAHALHLGTAGAAP
jgi:hypothetical protein